MLLAGALLKRSRIFSENSSCIIRIPNVWFPYVYEPFLHKAQEKRAPGRNASVTQGERQGGQSSARRDAYGVRALPPKTDASRMKGNH